MWRLWGRERTVWKPLNLIRELNPQLVFLDVQMPGLDGFGVIKKLLEKKARLPFFVFATAYDHYAVQAFEVNALDYLLKPIASPRLEKAIGKVRRGCGERGARAEKLDRLVQMMEERPAAHKGKLVVKSGGRLFLVDSDDVIYASIEDGVISIVTRDLEGQSNFRTVEELQGNLDPETFWRAHRSYLVNVNRIKEVVPWFKSSYQFKHARPQTDRNPRQPRPNQKPQRAAQPVSNGWIVRSVKTLLVASPASRDDADVEGQSKTDACVITGVLDASDSELVLCSSDLVS